MAKYIDADALYADTQKRIAEAHEARMAVVDDEFLDLINDAPEEEDVVEVVRCKDCVHRNPNGYRCMWNNMWHPLDGFCSDGKRRG